MNKKSRKLAEKEGTLAAGIGALGTHQSSGRVIYNAKILD